MSVPNTALIAAAISAPPKLSASACSTRSELSTFHQPSRPSPAARSSKPASGISTISDRYVSVKPSVSVSPGSARGVRAGDVGDVAIALMGSFGGLINLVEHALVTEEFRLRRFPAAELCDRRQFDFRKIARMLRRDSRVDWTVMVLRDDLLRLGRVQEFEIGFGNLLGAM